MKYSIKSQMIAIFVGLTGCLLFALLFINMNFLEPYYVSQKEDAFIKMYARLKGAMESGSIETQEELEEIWQIAENNNLSYLIVDETYSRMFTNVNDMDMLKRQLAGYMLNQAQKTGKVLESTEEYEIARSRNPWNKEEYIEMWGTFDDGSVFLIRSPIESIKESAEISNRFLIYIGCAAVAVCILFIWYFSKRLTAPILELAALSERMANLDFNAKYTSGGSNEIGNLGDNFNRMSERLESAISELKSANNRLLKDIEQKEKLEQMRNDFLGNVSHELKTPIALIQGYAEGLKEGVKDDAESREFYCDVIMDEAAKMNQMVRSLLELNQLEFGDEKMKFERFDLTELVRGILQSMDILAQQDGVEVIFRQETPVYVWADEYKVEQVVRNYVSNAFHHVSLEKIIEVKIKILQDKARVTVFNTGTAIPEEDKAHTREYGGNGIGLSIVKAIMESFRQKYGVINYDNGVEFWFELDVK